MMLKKLELIWLFQVFIVFLQHIFKDKRMTKEEIEIFNKGLLEHRERMKDPEYRKQLVIQQMENMKSFNNENDGWIPDIPQTDSDTYKNYVIPAYIRCGAIPKSELLNGRTYFGGCRNSSKAVWDADKNCFVYERTKWGSTYSENINHFEDDNGCDLFVPLKLIN